MPSHPADLPGVMELARFAVAGGFHHLSREAAQAARGCVAVWLEDVLRASIQVMQANNRCAGGCLSRLCGLLERKGQGG